MESANPLGKQRDVVVVDDDKTIAAALCEQLNESGYSARATALAVDGVEALLSGDAGLMIVNQPFSGFDSRSIVGAARHAWAHHPVFLVAPLEAVDGAQNGGAHNGRNHPVGALAAQIKQIETLLERLDDARPTKLRAGDLVMDLIDQTVLCNGQPIDLLRREFKLLEYFLRRPDQIVSRANLLEDLWRYSFCQKTHVIDVHVGNVRRKIEAVGATTQIVNIRGAGFMLTTDSHRRAAPRADDSSAAAQSAAASED